MGTDCRVPWLLRQPVSSAGSYTSPVFPLRQLLVEQTFKKRLLSCLIEGLGGLGEVVPSLRCWPSSGSCRTSLKAMSSF